MCYRNTNYPVTSFDRTFLIYVRPWRTPNLFCLLLSLIKIHDNITLFLIIENSIQHQRIFNTGLLFHKQSLKRKIYTHVKRWKRSLILPFYCICSKTWKHVRGITLCNNITTPVLTNSEPRTGSLHCSLYFQRSSQQPAEHWVAPAASLLWRGRTGWHQPRWMPNSSHTAKVKWKPWEKNKTKHKNNTEGLKISLGMDPK